jgi:hypothetical protein
VSGKGRNGRNK